VLAASSARAVALRPTSDAVGRVIDTGARAPAPIQGALSDREPARDGPDTRLEGIRAHRPAGLLAMTGCRAGDRLSRTAKQRGRAPRPSPPEAAYFPRHVARPAPLGPVVRSLHTRWAVWRIRASRAWTRVIGRA
jgi:hypothetical protein